MNKHVLLLTLTFSMVVWASGQSRRISGQVLSSEENEAIAGASVSENGTGTGVQTDVNGQFSINI